MTDDIIGIATREQYKKISSRLSTLIEDYINTDPGEKYKKIQALELYRDNSWGALQGTTFGWKDRPDTSRALTAWKDPADNIRALTEFYQPSSKLLVTILLRYLGSDKISILGHVESDETTIHGPRFP